MISQTIIAGTVGSDATLYRNSKGYATAQVDICQNRFKREDGEWVSIPEWHRIKFFGGTAEAAEGWLKKGVGVVVEGYNQSSSWEDDDGNRRFGFQVVAKSFRVVTGHPNYARTILLGNLGSDPELRYTGNGTAVATVSLATNYRPKGSDDTLTEWHRVTFWGRQAEAVAEYAQKGDALLIEGSNRSRKWEDADGNDRWTTEVHVDRFEFAGSPHAEVNEVEEEVDEGEVFVMDAGALDDNLPF